MPNAEKKLTRVITPPALLSYPHVFKPSRGPKNNPNETEKFSAVFIFVEGTDLKGLKKAVLLAGEEFFGKEEFAEGVKNGSLRMPFRTDSVAKGYPKDSTFISARSQNKPGCVMPYTGEDGRPAPVTDEAIMYPGARVRASLEAFGYDNIGKGVSFSLSNIQWLGDGDRLDGRAAAADDFDVVQDADEENVASLL